MTLFRLLAEGEPEAFVSGFLVQTRELVARAADPHLTAYLHDSVSVLEAQTGRLHEAHRHPDIAASIIERFPNAWIEQVIYTSRICLACIECDPVTATKHVKKARNLSDVTGDHINGFTLDVNEACINLFIGKFARAEALLQRVVQQE